MQLIFRFLYKIWCNKRERNKFDLFDCDFKERIILYSVNYIIPIILFFFLILLKVALLLSKKLKSVNFLARISSSDLKNVCLHHRDIFFLFLFTFLSPSGRTCLNYDVKSAHHIFANPRNLIILWEKNIRI